jgi:hypothetical protein
MPTEEHDYEDDEDFEPRPRTMKRRPEVEDDDDTEEVSPRVSSAPKEEEEDSSDSSGLAIRGGWTEGQKTMDSSSDYAQVLKLENDIQIIKFLDDQPYANYRRHWVDRMTAKGPQKRAYTCLETVGKTCPLCSIADRPQAVSAFNVALVGDDGQVMLKTWDVGARIFNVLKTYANNPKIGPLSKGYFAVSKSGVKQNTQVNVIPVRENALLEDYEITPPTAAEIKSAGKYDSSIIQIPKKSDLEEIAQEISEYD